MRRPPRRRIRRPIDPRVGANVCLLLRAVQLVLIIATTCQTSSLFVAEGFRGVFAPIQPVFSLSASSYGDKLRAARLNQQHHHQQQQQQQQQHQPTFVEFPGGTLEFSWHNSISDIPAKVWDGCLTKNKTTPFLEHSWLHSLEASGCASETTGWIPHHLSIHIHYSKTTKGLNNNNSTNIINNKINNGIEKEKKNGKNSVNKKETVLMDGCVPVYIKTHSMGEFVFDDSWADAAFRNGLDYYPKLLIGVPFTPVNGPRILWHSQVLESITSHEDMDELNCAVGKFLKQSASARGWSSVHINFCTNSEATALAGKLTLNGATAEEESTINGGKKDTNQTELASNYDKDVTATVNEVTEDDNNKDIRQRLKSMLTQQLQDSDSNTYLRRTSLQYHWRNRNPQRGGSPFRSFEDYLSCFKSKRRINIRRERSKALQDGQIKIQAISGEDILQVEGLVERMYEIYMSTVDKMFWGRKYLTLEFFQMLCQTTFVNNIVFLCVRQQKTTTTAVAAAEEEEECSNMDIGDDVSETNGVETTSGKGESWTADDVFAGTFNVVKDGIFYGRYWGCLPGRQVKNLHFETCYWSAIDYCIENGLKRMEPGAGGGDYKWARGFDPQLVHSVHYICNPLLRGAVSQFVESETEYNVALKKHLLRRSSVAERNPEKD